VDRANSTEKYNYSVKVVLGETKKIW